MSKKYNNKKSKKNTRKNYRIESLEPRLLMDATMDQWHEELDSISSATTHVEQADFNLASTSAQGNEVDGLLVQDKSTGDFRKATIGDVLSEKLFTNRRLVSPAKILEAVTNDIKGIIAKYATSTTVLTEQDVLNYFNSEAGADGLKQTIGSESQVVTVGKHTNPGLGMTSFYYKTQEYVNVVNNISYGLKFEGGKLVVYGVAFDHCVVNGELSAGSSLWENPTSLSNSYRADVNEKLGLDASYEEVGVGQHYEFSFELDGLKSTSANLNSSRGISIQFNEKLDTSVAPSVGEEARTGVLGLVGDTDGGADISVGYSLNASNFGITLKSGVSADFTFDIRDRGNFVFNSHFNPGMVHYTKGFNDNQGKWSDSVVDSFNNIAMGKILGKLQQLSKRLADIQSGNETSIDFGGVLAQNANTLLGLTAMLEGVLNNPPKTVQELVTALRSCAYQDNTNYPANAFIDQNGNLVIPFHLFLNNSNNVVGINVKDDGTKDIVTQNEFDVSVAKDALSALFGIDVVVNDSVKVRSSANLAFDLVVPLVEYPPVQLNNSLEDIGIDSEKKFESIVCGNVVYGGDVAYDNFGGLSNYVTSNIIPKLQLKNASVTYSEIAGVSNYVVYTADNTNEEIIPEDFLELSNTSWKKGYVVNMGGVSYTKVSYGGKELKVHDNDVVTTLNSLLAQYSDFDGARAVGIQDPTNVNVLKAIVILFGENTKEDEVKKISIDGTSLKNKSLSLQKILLSNELAPKKYTSPFTITIQVGGAAGITGTLSFAENFFNGISNVGDIAAAIQNAVDASSLAGKISVEVFGRKIRFCSSQDFTVVFSDLSVAQWLGFASISIDSSAYPTNKECMEIVFEGGSSCKISLENIGDQSSIQDIFNKIVSQCSGNVVQQGMELVGANGLKIEKIIDIKGYSIATLLGLTGCVDDGKENFRADVSFSEEYLKVWAPNTLARYENFNFSITNEVIDGNINIYARYGAFGVNVVGDLTGASCVSHIPYGSGEGDTYNAASETVLGIDLKDKVSTSSVIRLGTYETSLSGSTLGSVRYYRNTALNMAEQTYGPGNVSAEDVFSSVAEVVSQELVNYFFGEPKDDSDTTPFSFLKTLDLPLQGKNVLEIMGLRSKLVEMTKCLETGNFATLQDLTAYFESQLGVSFVFSLSKDGIGIDIEWTKTITAQATELGGMDFGVDGFNLGGSLEAYQNVSLTLTAHIDYRYDVNDGKYIATLDLTDANKPKIVGQITLWAPNIVTDVNVCVREEDGTSKQLLLQVGQYGNQNSCLALIANVMGEAVNVTLNGTLFVSRYGLSAGSISIGYNGAPKTVTYSAGILPKAVFKWKDEGNVHCSDTAVGADDIIVDLTGITEELKETHLYEKLRQVADGMSDTVRRVQSNLNSVLLKKTVRNIPLVGDSIISAADCLSGLYSGFVEPFRKYVYKAEGLNARSVAEKLYMLLKGSLVDLEGEKGKDWAGENFTDSYKGILFSESTSNDRACWRIRLHGTYVLDENGNFDLGYSGLGLKAEGGVKIVLEWTLDIGFGVSLCDGAFLLLSNGYRDKDNQIADFVETSDGWHLGDDFKVKIKITPDANVKGALGFLAMNATLANTDYEIRLGLDLNDGVNDENESRSVDHDTDKSAKKVINFSGLKSGLSTEANLSGEVPIELGLSLGIGGYETSAPHIDAMFNLNWAAEMGKGFGSIQNVSFNNIVFDCGTFVQKTVGNVIGKINRTLEPIRPLINFLQAEIPVLNKLPAGAFHMTVLDLIKKYGKSRKMDFGFLDDIIEIDRVVKLLNQISNEGINIGDWTVYDVQDNSPKGQDINKQGLQYLTGKVANVKNFLENNAQNAFDVNLASLFTKGTSSASWNSSLGTIKSSTWAFPLLDLNTAREEVMCLLMGGDADLVKFNMRPLEFDFDWSKSFPIVGPLCADIGFNFGVKIDLCFGYDTYGFRGWVNSGYKDYGCLLNGFYIDDLDGQGKDVAEVIFHSGIVAGASVCGRAGINVGLNFNVNMDFIDPNYDGKIRLAELAGLASFNPLDMFDISATVEAKAFAYLDLFMYRKEWTLWSSGAFELFTTAKKSNDPVLATHIDGQGLFVCAGDYAEYRNKGDLSDGVDVINVEVIDAKKVAISVSVDGKQCGSTCEYDVEDGVLNIYGGMCNDTIIVKCADGVKADFDVLVFGGEGNDIVNLSALNLENGHYAVLSGGAGGDCLYGALGDRALNIIFGEEEAYSIKEKDEKKRVVVEGFPTEVGGTTNYIYGGSAVNIVMAGSGNDYIVGGVCPVNYLFGDCGRLSILFDASAENNWVTDVAADFYDLYDEGGDDIIIGSSTFDFIYGGAGADKIDAMGGNDEIHGGQGNDTIYGGSGNDTIFGDDGVDIIFGDRPASNAMVIAQDGSVAEAPYGFVSRELKGGNGNSPVTVFDFAQGLTLDKGEFDNDIIEGGNGSDIIFGDRGSNDGAGGNDVINGGANNDFIDGDGGNDTINGGSGDDIIYGGLGNDTLDGGADNDFVFGDNGHADYAKQTNASAEWAQGLDLSEKRRIFGDTIDVFNAYYGLKQDSRSVVHGGDDVIVAGNGHDIIDGQNGNDSYKVNFMGGYNNAYTNIMESGDDAEDSLTVNGTTKNDNILIRSSDSNAGLVALLPDSDKKTQLERINFWKVDGRELSGLENVSVNGLAGNDTIAVDGTLSTLSIDAGAGNDTINIGQLFASERDTGANIFSSDVFKDSTIETTQGYLSEGPTHATSVVGGAGNDTFNVLHTTAPVSLSGGIGDDVFNVASYTGVDKNNETYAIENGPVTIIGGAGTDTTSINGTEADDTFVFADGTVYSSNVDVQSVGIENYNVNGGAGDDSFYVLDTKDDSVINIHGNDGNDSFYNGGAQVDGDVENVIVLREESEESSATTDENIDIQFVDENGDELEDLSFTLKEDGTGVFGYGIKLSKELEDDQTIKVTIFVPRVSDENYQRGDRGVYFVITEDDSVRYETSLTLEFNKDNYSTPQNVNLIAFKDDLREGDDYFALLHNVVVSGNNANQLKVNTCRNMMVFLSESSEVADKNASVTNNFVLTSEYVVTEKEFVNGPMSYVIVPLNSLPDMSDVRVWADDSSVSISASREDNALKLSWKTGALKAGSVIHYNYEHNTLVIENQSVVQMKYDTENLADANKLQLHIPMEEYDVALNDTALDIQCLYDENSKVLTINADKLPPEISSQGGLIRYWEKQAIAGESSTDLLHTNSGFENILFESSDGSQKLTFSYMTVLNSDGYYKIKNDKITFFDSSNNQMSLTGTFTYKAVEIFQPNCLETFFNGRSIELDTSRDVRIEFYSVYELTSSRVQGSKIGYYYEKAGNQIIICSNATGAPITVSGTIVVEPPSQNIIPDEEKLNVPFGKTPSKITVEKNTIENINGNLFEDGAGSFGVFATNPLMLRYRKVGSTSDTYAEKNEASQADLDKWAAIVEATKVDENKCIDRFFVNNMDNEHEAESSMKQLSGVAVSDSLKKDSAYVSSKAALVESDKNSVHFAHEDTYEESGKKNDRNISFGNMEYGEINLGTNKDTVDIHKTIYREDGFQTFTVVNSGKGGDTVNVHSYKDGADDQLVINAGEGDDTVTANGENVTKEGMIVFGGLGNDTIDVGSDSSLVFGDRGQVLYHDDEGNVVTRLGDDRTGSLDVHQGDEGWNAGGSDYATGKEKGDEAYYQTDGNRYGASIARTVTEDQGGKDTITLADGRNVVFGGFNPDETVDEIKTGDGNDLVFGDNGYATFGGHHSVASDLGMKHKPVVDEKATLSFNFQGASQTGLNPGDEVGAADFKANNWNNISGSIAGTYGNDDAELVRFDNGTRASAVSVSYGGIESHRVTSTDRRINLQSYTLGLHGTSSNKDAKMMNSGLMTTAPNDQCDNQLEVAVDGLAQYFESYQVAVYLDLPDANSWETQSVRKVTLTSGAYSQSFYVNDYAGKNFNGSFVQSHYSSLAMLEADLQYNADLEAQIARGDLDRANAVFKDTSSNYVVFDVPAEFATDRIIVTIEDGIKETNRNGKDIPGIAGIQVKGTFHKQDVAASTDIDYGGNDNIETSGGEDIVVGGTGNDSITTFGDELYGLYDSDVVFGDNAKLTFMDRDNNINTASTLTTAESVAVTNLEASYDDTIDTGDGNDTVVGGIGHDTINAGATAAAEAVRDDVKVLSVNFTSENADESAKIRQATYKIFVPIDDQHQGTVGEDYVLDGAGRKIAIDEHGKKIIETVGETAGVVADNDWHNMYVKNGELHDMEDYSSHYVDGVSVKISTYHKNDRGTWNEYNAGNAAITHENSDELDGDTANSKLYNGYIASQQQYEIKLTLDHIDQFREKNGLANKAKCDLYVYLGGDNNDTDTYNYLYRISLNNDEVHYLNDWTGHKFDGDYRDATRHPAMALVYGIGVVGDSGVRVELVGNYIVFRDFTGDRASIRILNEYTGGGQSPKNLPVISAVQIVAGEGRQDPRLAVGGDHDKDLVYGDDAKLTFDIDIPFAEDEVLAEYQNRVTEAKSIAIDQAAVTKISTEDTITTGKDRDVVVGGEGKDTITMGDGDDVAVGGSANLIVEHNNPLGVFTPNTEIALDQHTINLNLHQNYLDNDNANQQSFQTRLEQGYIAGVQEVDNTNDRKNEISLGKGRNLHLDGSTNQSALVVEEQQQSTDPGTTPGTTPGTDPGTTPGNDQPGNDQPGNDQPGTQQGDTLPTALAHDGNSVQLSFNQASMVNVHAGQTIRLVAYNWDGINSWHPNLVMRANPSNGPFPVMEFSWQGGGEPQQFPSKPGEEWFFEVNIPDAYNEVDEQGRKCLAVYVTATADTTFMLTLGSSGN